jgi:hypothetical protein
MSPSEIIADLRILAEDMNRLGTQLATNKALNQKYTQHGYELLTGAYVVTYWADDIEAMINAEVTGAPPHGAKQEK